MKKQLLTIGFLLVLFAMSPAQNPPPSNTFDRQVAAVLSRIKTPTFPKKDFQIEHADNFQNAVNQTIVACHKAGGGRVVIPKGEYVCNGPIRMLSNVNLHLSEGTLIRFGTNPADYLPVVKVRWEGTVCTNYSPLIYAHGQKNLAITGNGTLDGQADKFWFAWKKLPNGDDQEKAKTILRKMGETGVPESERVFGAGYKLRPTLLELYDCEGILLDGFTARRSPFWTIHPVFSKNITIRNLKIGHGTTNDDGIDPDSCEDVLIENCRISTDDDPISIKAGRDQDAWKRRGTRNVVVRKCTLQSRIANGFCVGSEMSGGVENIWVDDCTMPNVTLGITLKANLDRGGFVRNVWVRNVTIDSCRQAAIRMQMDYHSYRGGNFPPDFDRISLENIHVRSARDYGWWLVGVPSKPIGLITMRNVAIDRSGKGNKTELTNLRIEH
ncbi:glycoside hydrolase family 28 protein [Larkinella punicea]|uniref:Glycoside hydrolase family 28 protein n=1 Tax=Larkinella punicea TaxID=2315727 RepID=A0A368JLQ0_9BACT|nr:glycoside hydrolase family 28 protein [Larkinella punicea]RCR67483.1 glycoside hydrolase family 28 protein [Larkinella punicea]